MARLSLGVGLTRRGGGGGGGAAAGIPTIASSVYWLDATDASTISETSNSVSEIRDRLGGTTKMVQGEGSLQPTTGTATINGLNVLNFPTNEARLKSNVMPTTNAAVAVSMVIEIADTYFVLLRSDGTRIAAIGQSDNSSGDLDRESGSPLYFANGSPLATVTRNGLYNAISGTAGPVILTITGMDMSNWTDLEIFYHDVGVFGVVGSLGEMTVMNAPTTAQLNALGEYLATKWGTATWTTMT
jgi:hypothetical protein